MNFQTYITTREACKRYGGVDVLGAVENGTNYF